MNAHAMGTRTRWTVAIFAGVSLVAVFVLLIRLPPQTSALPGLLKAPTPKSNVEIVEPVVADPVLKEELELRDLRPLFLPTRRNAVLPEPKLEADRAFLKDEELQFGFVATGLNIEEDLTPVVMINHKPLRLPAKKGNAAVLDDKAGPVDILIETGPGRALGFGRGQAEVAPMAPRGGFLEVRSISTGQLIISEALPTEARPPTDKPWEPLELQASMDAAGLSMPLVVTASSRVEEVDAHYRNYLVRKYRIGARLEPGFYRIIVAP